MPAAIPASKPAPVITPLQAAVATATKLDPAKVAIAIKAMSGFTVKGKITAPPAASAVKVARNVAAALGISTAKGKVVVDAIVAASNAPAPVEEKKS